MYYTYILRSIKSSKLYIGQTENLERRLCEHNSNQSKSTKGKGPWELIFSKRFETRSEAVKYELKLKSIKNNKYIINNLESI